MLFLGRVNYHDGPVKHLSGKSRYTVITHGDRKKIERMNRIGNLTTDTMVAVVCLTEGRIVVFRKGEI